MRSESAMRLKVFVGAFGIIGILIVVGVAIPLIYFQEPEPSNYSLMRDALYEQAGQCVAKTVLAGKSDAIIDEFKSTLVETDSPEIVILIADLNCTTEQATAMKLTSTADTPQ